MRLAPLVLLIGLTACDPVPASPTQPETAVPEVEPVQLLPCPDPDPYRECEFDHAKAPEYFEAALKGDYQAQRNISALHTASRAWNVQRPIQGCAWRMVIMVSRPAESRMDDAGMYQIQCASLNEADLAASKALAQVIYRRIHGADMPALPTLAD